MTGIGIRGRVIVGTPQKTGTHPRDEAKRLRDRYATAWRMQRKVLLIQQHADDLLDLRVDLLAAAFADPKAWADAREKLASAIESLGTLQSEIARRVPE